MKVISFFGFSGSGKTKSILNAIRLLKVRFDYNIGVIKYIHDHKIDEEGKDSFKFTESGAVYSILKNSSDSFSVMFNSKLKIDELIEWLKRGPLKIDLIFTESFRHLDYPAVLCVSDVKDINDQMTDNVKMVSGLIAFNKQPYNYNKIPIVDVEKDLDIFIELFNLV